jgi:cytochrome c oxidase subunit 3
VSLSVAFSALGAGVLLWLLIVRKLTVKPWEATGPTTESDAAVPRGQTRKVGLGIFLAVVTSLFGLFISAYYMRRGGHEIEAGVSDWTAIAEPPILWLNTFLLILASVAMQWTRTAVARGDGVRTRTGLAVSGLLTVCFLAGQLIAWRELAASGLFTPRNPAAAFFILLTTVHGLHLIGGLVVWARSSLRLSSGRTELIDVKTSVELCAVYWHYLLLVWLVLFAILLAT